MGKPTGFLEYERENSKTYEPEERTKSFREFHVFLPEEKQRMQGARCMDCGVPFCQSGMMLGGMVSGCPLNNLIPEWNDLLYTGNYQQAYNRLAKTNNFPEFTSRVCPAPCEAACTCSLNGDAISIKENEYAIIEKAFEDGSIQPAPPTVKTGKKVAVVGSGPAGLAAAAQLNKRGHEVTVFERDDRIGGLLMYGIPNMKLEKDIIERRIELMRQEGVVFETNADIGKSIKPAKLLKEYDRILLACGASKPRDIAVTGRGLKGVYFAVDFLRETTKSLLNSGLTDNLYISAKGKQVVVIGGGDTGNDCVGTAIRHGCSSVLQLEMMPKPSTARGKDNPWPQWPRVLKTDYGQEEAIAVFGKDPRLYQTTVKEFIGDEKGNLKKIRTVMLENKMGENGKNRMLPVEGSEKEIEADLVLIAAGFLGAQEYVSKAFGLELTEKGTVKAEKGYQTKHPKIFTAGDMHRGQSLVVWAIKEGREAAKEIDKSLMGYSNLL